MRAQFIIAVIAASSFVYLSGTNAPSALAADNSALKTEISRSLNGTALVSTVTFGGRAIATGYETDWPVITIVNADTGDVTYRVESGIVRFNVVQSEMRSSFAPGSEFHVSGVDLKDDRLELKLQIGSGDFAKLKLILGQNWQSRLAATQVMTQLARVFELPPALVSSPNTASATEGNTEQPTQTPDYVSSPTDSSTHSQFDAIRQSLKAQITKNGQPKAPPSQSGSLNAPEIAPSNSTANSTEPSDPTAQEKLGEDFENGTNGHPQDDTQAVYWFRKAAEQGNALGEFKLGEMYASGRGGLTKDNVQAIQSIQQAAEKGVLLAQAALAWISTAKS